MTSKKYSPLRHQLTTVTFTLHLPHKASGWRSEMVATGYSATRRGSLWLHTEQWADPLEVTGMTMSDAVHHLALVAIQDRPATQEMLDHKLLGGQQYEDQQLPF